MGIETRGRRQSQGGRLSTALANRTQSTFGRSSTKALGWRRKVTRPSSRSWSSGRSREGPTHAPNTDESQRKRKSQRRGEKSAPLAAPSGAVPTATRAALFSRSNVTGKAVQRSPLPHPPHPPPTL